MTPAETPAGAPPDPTGPTGGRPLHVVVGAGPLGLAVAREALARGHRVRLVSRRGRIPDAPPAAEIAAADARHPDRLRPLVAGAAAVHHCAGGPYDRWPQTLPAIMLGLIQAVADTGAVLVYGDNLYAVGPVDGPITEDLPDRPVGAKAKVRASVAALLLSAHRDGALPAAIVRTSDFFGPHVEQSALGRRQFAAAIAGRPVPILGAPDQPHSFCWLGDFAAAMVAVAGRPDAWGEVWHAPCPPPVTQARALEAIAGRRVRVSRATRPMLTLGGLFTPALRELKEIVYQFDRPMVVDSSKIGDRLGLQPTPFAESVAAARAAYGFDLPRSQVRPAGTPAGAGKPR